jgi:hypothetical protein
MHIFMVHGVDPLVEEAINRVVGPGETSSVTWGFEKAKV